MSDAPPFVQAGLADYEHELGITRRVLARVPEEHLAWKPHAKSYSLGQLARHLAHIPHWMTVTVTTDELDGAAIPRNPDPTSTREILDAFEANVAESLAALKGASGETFGAPWTLRVGDHVVFTQPKAGVARGFVISHMIHHRAQLAVYLRLLDVPVPSIYGPSADESF
jgi:uncharacterized damage-inducible protein DinB